MSELTFWAAFLLAAMIINISPGPELVFVVTRTITHGRKHGFYSALGAGSGSMIHVIMVALGLALLLSTSLVAFHIIKLLGACYLFYLGIKAFLSKRTEALSFNEDVDHVDTSFTSFRNGLFVGLLNPKSVIFFMAFLPQFVRADSGTFGEQIMNLGGITILMGIVFEIVVILLISKFSTLLFRKKILASLLDKISGSILVLLGLRLAFTSQNK